ncbi:MAG: porin [Alphaproteobacteria bacterium]|nr:porin [Alphaproteobacteria bacterium]
MKKIILTTALVTLASTTPGLAHAASDADMEKIQAQMQIMMERIEALEAENKELKKTLTTEPAITSPGRTAAATPDTIEPSAGDIAVPGTGTTLKFGGYVKANAISDIGSGYGADYANFSAIPLDGSATAKKDTDFHAHVRDTRLNATVTTPTDIGDVKAFVEVDFFGTRGSELITNGHGIQVRHAYGQVGGLLAGQTWSNFIDMDAYPESLDYVGPVGISLLRQTQVRYSGDLGNDLSYSVSLENPNADFTKNSSDSDTVSTHERMPDFIAQIKQQADWGHWSLSGLARDINIENETTSQSESEIGYGLALASKMNVGDKDNLKVRLTYGDGIGRYLFDAAAGGNTAIAYNNGTLDSQKAWAGYAAYQHHWTDTLRSNIEGGYIGMDNNTTLLGTTAVNESIWSAHANLIWQPVKQYKVGVEYMHGHRELENNTEGDLDRVQASFIYALN